MGYLDTTDAEMIALTRQHRVGERFFAEQRRIWCRKAHERLAFPFVQKNAQDMIEAAWQEREAVSWWKSPPHIVWKNAQWAAHVRSCGYCNVRMTRTPNAPRTCTVDHRKPRAYGGKDEPANWIMACLDCNTRKGTMSEARFREHLAIWKEIDARLTA